jgi:hypothetical protein
MSLLARLECDMCSAGKRNKAYSQAYSQAKVNKRHPGILFHSVICLYIQCDRMRARIVETQRLKVTFKFKVKRQSRQKIPNLRI